ncbi:DUF2218 domain-containing protein [Mesorhizobium sp. VK24D]|uniref:DUF2218 domain-containing protein n=1 Tax=Mesorhizobium album TaxID=3072314 RepID=A0ABU4XV44_9HYPH|nr:DUF2218 domain-containing protein [Mesorhizobium sp. VK24D]MDX8477953.1 DUF2218 domain-containing protein [Mesorhizobium sp. VK24D]
MNFTSFIIHRVRFRKSDAQAASAQPGNRMKATRETVMHTAEARASTDHAKHYLAQLCRHAGKMGQHASLGHSLRSHHAGEAPPPVLHVDWSETTGTIQFEEGKCILHASDNALLVRIEAATESALHRLQDGIVRRLETFGHREHVTVQWQASIFQPTGGQAEIAGDIRASGRPMTLRWRSRLARNLALAAVLAVAIAAHLGLLGATIATAPWSRWGATAILALIVLKFIVTVGVHLAGGTFAFRRGKALFTERRQRHSAR